MEKISSKKNSQENKSLSQHVWDATNQPKILLIQPTYVTVLNYSLTSKEIQYFFATLFRSNGTPVLCTTFLFFLQFVNEGLEPMPL